jgi:hypothetical protein
LRYSFNQEKSRQRHRPQAAVAHLERGRKMMRSIFLILLISVCAVRAQSIEEMSLGVTVTFPESERWQPLERLKPEPRLDIWRKIQKGGGGNLMLLISSFPSDEPPPKLEALRAAMVAGYTKSRQLVRVEDSAVGGHKAFKLVIRHRPDDPDTGYMVTLLTIVGNRRYTISHAGLSPAIDADADFSAFVKSVSFLSTQ